MNASTNAAIKPENRPSLDAWQYPFANPSSRTASTDRSLDAQFSRALSRNSRLITRDAAAQNSASNDQRLDDANIKGDRDRSTISDEQRAEDKDQDSQPASDQTDSQTVETNQQIAAVLAQVDPVLAIQSEQATLAAQKSLSETQKAAKLQAQNKPASNTLAKPSAERFSAELAPYSQPTLPFFSISINPLSTPAALLLPDSQPLASELLAAHPAQLALQSDTLPTSALEESKAQSPQTVEQSVKEPILPSQIRSLTNALPPGFLSSTDSSTSALQSQSVIAISGNTGSSLNFSASKSPETYSPNPTPNQSVGEQALTTLKITMKDLKLDQDRREISLSLTPAALGTLKIQVKSTNNLISVQFTVSSEQARKELTRSIDTFRSAASMQGLRIDDLTVTLALETPATSASQPLQTPTNPQTPISNLSGKQIASNSFAPSDLPGGALVEVNLALDAVG